MPTATNPTSADWIAVCPLETLTAGRGVASLYHAEQVAVFRLDDRPDPTPVYAVGNLDPFSGAHVMARGIVGSHGDTPTVASPMYKQRFDLRTGECLDAPGVRLPTYQVRIRDGVVEVAALPRYRGGTP